MPLMCDECKCSTYYNEDTDMYSCENDCACCNDPDYMSDEDRLTKLVAYIKLHQLSLIQDCEQVEIQMESFNDLDSDEYRDLDITDIHLHGSISALGHILHYIEYELDKPLTKGL